MRDHESTGWAKLIWRYQLGDPEAIRELAAQRGSLVVGLILVLSAGIAREYDHEYIGEATHFFFLPLLASLLIALILYGSLRLFVLRSEVSPAKGRLVTFVSLFWLTAPLAWIYALPVERMMPPVAAAAVNIALLVLVATWRVWLLGRVCSLLFDASMPRVLGAILFPGSILFWIASFLGTLSLLSIMGGISLSPQSRLILNANQFVFSAAPLLLVAALVALFQTKTRPTPVLRLAETQRRPPFLGLAAILVVAALLAIPAQIEMKRFVTVRTLISDEDYVGAIRFLSAHSADQFPASYAIPPDPQRPGTGARSHMMGIVAALEPDDPEWIRSKYLSYIGLLMGIGNNPMRDLELAIYAQELARLGQTDSFARDHPEAFMWQAEWWRGRFEEREADDPDRARYKALYTQLGVDFETGGPLASTPR